MQTKRDYAISLGLARPGSRGRLSREANIAIEKALKEGKVFRDAGSIQSGGADGNTDDAVVSAAGDTAVTYKTIPEFEINHQQDKVWGVDRSGRTPIVIAFCSCNACGRAIKYCLHETPKLPSWIDSETYMEKPRV